MENEGQLLILASFLMIGAVLVPSALAHAGPAEVALVLVSLFLVRPAAIWLSLGGSGAPRLTRAFLGWFGPRGLATALFALLVIGSVDIDMQRGEQVLTIATLAVVFSAVLHGVTAVPAARWLGHRLGDPGPPIDAGEARGK